MIIVDHNIRMSLVYGSLPPYPQRHGRNVAKAVLVEDADTRTTAEAADTGIGRR